jgi:hypothetical protein
MMLHCGPHRSEPPGDGSQSTNFSMLFWLSLTAEPSLGRVLVGSLTAGNPRRRWDGLNRRRHQTARARTERCHRSIAEISLAAAISAKFGQQSWRGEGHKTPRDEHATTSFAILSFFRYLT